MNNSVDRISELLSQLQSSDFYEREQAVTELGSYKADEAVAGLVMAIEDPDAGIREIAADYLSRMDGDITPRLLINFLAHDEITTRNLAAEIIVKIGPKAVPFLISSIDVDDYDVRKFIVDILGLIKDERSVETLCQRLWDENINVVCSAAEALGMVGNPEAIPALVAAFEKIEDTQLQALEALGKIGDPSSLEYLYKFIQTDDSMILYAGIEAIGLIGEPSSVKILTNYLNYEDSSISEIALMAIINISILNDGKIDYDFPLDKFSDFLFEGIKNKDKNITDFTLDRLKHWFGNNVIHGLVDVIDSVEVEEKKLIVETLGQVGGSATKIILEKFPGATPEAKKVLLDIIKQSIDDDVTQELILYAKDPEPEVRQKIAHIIGFSSLEKGPEILKKLASDEIGHVRSAAYAALGWLCGEEEVDFINQGLDDKYKDVREASAGAMMIIGGPKVIEKFHEALFQDDAEKQRIAVMALGMIGDDSVVTPLIEAINHPEESVRRSAIIALSRIGDKTAIESITVALNDESSQVRKAAVSGLLELVGEEAVHEIRLLLEDVDLWVRYHTINAIGETCNITFSEYIIPYLSDEQDIIKIAALKAVTRMGCRQVVPSISKLCNNANEDLVKAANQAISSLEGAM